MILPGFAVGIVEKDKMLNGAQVQVGDVAIGIASHGVHSNGFSLVRKVIEQHRLQLSDRPQQLAGQNTRRRLVRAHPRFTSSLF